MEIATHFSHISICALIFLVCYSECNTCKKDWQGNCIDLDAPAMVMNLFPPPRIPSLTRPVAKQHTFSPSKSFENLHRLIPTESTRIWRGPKRANLPVNIPGINWSKPNIVTTRNRDPLLLPKPPPFQIGNTSSDKRRKQHRKNTNYVKRLDTNGSSSKERSNLQRNGKKQYQKCKHQRCKKDKDRPTKNKEQRKSGKGQVFKENKHEKTINNVRRTKNSQQHIKEKNQRKKGSKQRIKNRRTNDRNRHVEKEQNKMQKDKHKMDKDRRVESNYQHRMDKNHVVERKDQHKMDNGQRNKGKDQRKVDKDRGVVWKDQQKMDTDWRLKKKHQPIKVNLQKKTDKATLEGLKKTHNLSSTSRFWMEPLTTTTPGSALNTSNKNTIKNAKRANVRRKFAPVTVTLPKKITAKDTILPGISSILSVKVAKVSSVSKTIINRPIFTSPNPKTTIIMENQTQTLRPEKIPLTRPQDTTQTIITMPEKQASKEPSTFPQLETTKKLYKWTIKVPRILNKMPKETTTSKQRKTTSYFSNSRVTNHNHIEQSRAHKVTVPTLTTTAQDTKTQLSKSIVTSTIPSSYSFTSQHQQKTTTIPISALFPVAKEYWDHIYGQQQKQNEYATHISTKYKANNEQNVEITTRRKQVIRKITMATVKFIPKNIDGWTESDNRPSAVGIGTIGAVVIIAIIVGVVCLDAATLYRDAKRIRKKLYRIFRPLAQRECPASLSKQGAKWAHFTTHME